MADCPTCGLPRCPCDEERGREVERLRAAFKANQDALDAQDREIAEEQQRAERLGGVLLALHGYATLIRDHGCRPERVEAILQAIESGQAVLAAAQPEEP